MPSPTDPPANDQRSHLAKYVVILFLTLFMLQFVSVLTLIFLVLLGYCLDKFAAPVVFPIQHKQFHAFLARY